MAAKRQAVASSASVESMIRQVGMIPRCRMAPFRSVTAEADKELFNRPTLADGDISELHIGLKGTMSALFLKDLAQKTHSGLEGRVRAGHSGGGLSFGYRVVRGLRADGTLITGEVEIAQDEAAIVQRVFAAYAGGQSPRAIAKRLNVAGVAGARGGKWSSVLLLGGAKRETGMLRNRLYIGERVWNRQRFIKDPITGKRVVRMNPRETWVTTQVPALVIIDRDLWAAAQVWLEVGRRSLADPDVLPGVEAPTSAPNRGAAGCCPASGPGGKPRLELLGASSLLMRAVGVGGKRRKSPRAAAGGLGVFFSSAKGDAGTRKHLDLLLMA